MTCLACGTVNEVGRKFCGECGSRLALTCTACGATNAPASRFCGDCGTPLGGPDQPTAAPFPGGRAPATSGPAVPSSGSQGEPSVEAAATELHAAERRLVTVLFADLVGFTNLAEDRDPEAVRELLTTYFDLARVIIDRYGGTVEKFIGDAVMAVWGTPTAHEDDAERAVRAALELVDSITTLGDGIRLRAGVLTGEAAVTIGATGQGMVAGDLVNTASRLQAVAPPGSVLVGDSTARAASGAIAFEPAGDQVLKGKTTPVVAHVALRVVARRRGAGRSESLDAPFVGRDAEIRLLKELFHTTGRERRARLVSIVGQAGIGKSRLLWEFSNYTDGLAEVVYWHEGRSPAYGEGITFWALGEMVRKRAGLAETDDEATTRERIAATLADFVPDERERRGIEPRLLQLLGIVDGGRAVERQELFAAWRTFFERVAARGTVALVFEDLHWADAGLLDFIEHVLEWSRNHAIYIVTLARPELLERRPTWGAGQRNFTSISLEPLTDEAMRRLLAGLVPGLPESTFRTILSRAEGIPLYAVETVRMLLHEGRLEVDDDGYRPVGDLSELAVPDTLHALIAARLDALEAADRSLLQDGAVLGQSFVAETLAAISGQSVEIIEPRLRGLVRRELLELDTDPRSPERGQYRFVQGLIREVAYSTLSRRDRRSRHLAAARYYESLGEDELAGILATQYLDAYRAAPEGPEAEAIAGQARLALGGAALRAAALGSSEQALAYLEQAMTVTADPLERAQFLEQAGAVGQSAGQFDRARGLYERAVEIHRDLGDRLGAARVTARLGSISSSQGQPARAIELLEAALVDLEDLGSDPAVVALRVELARAYDRNGDEERALVAADRAMAEAERLDLLDSMAEAMVTRGTALGELGRVREAAIVLRGAVEFSAEHNLARPRLRGLNNLANYTVRTDPRSALRWAEAGIEEARRLGNRENLITLVGTRAEAAIRTGDWETSRALIEELLGYHLQQVDALQFAVTLAILSALQGGRAADTIEHPESVLADVSDPQFSGFVTFGRAWIALAGGRLDDVDEIVRRGADSPVFGPLLLPIAGHAAAWLGSAERLKAARARLDGLGVHGATIEASILSLEAGSAALAGGTADAVSGFTEAARMWRDHGVAFDLALSQLDCALLVGLDHPVGRAAADEARTIFERLGARPFLARLAEAPSGGVSAATRSRLPLLAVAEEVTSG